MRIINNLKKKLTHYTWELAYFDSSTSVDKLDLNTIHIVKNPYKSKWFADPFILKDSDDYIILLVEEFDVDVKRGRIAQIVIDKVKDSIISCDIILDLPTHLSFPAIYRIGDEIYVHPENSASGASYIYNYDERNKKLVNPIKILDEPVTDAIIIQYGEEYKMYATKLPEPNGDILRIYTAKDFFGPYTYYSDEVYQPCRARMAGKFIEKKNLIIRPAQDCDGAYGKAVIFYNGHSVLSEIRSHYIKYAGIHTFNTQGKICIIDLKRYDYPLLVMLKNLIKRIL